MAQRALGKITTTAGTLVRITNNESDPTKRYPAHSYIVQALPTNTKLVYIGNSALNRSTGGGIFATLGAPASATATPPSFSATIAYAPDALNLNDIFIDVDQNGEGVIVSCTRG